MWLEKHFAQSVVHSLCPDCGGDDVSSVMDSWAWHTVEARERQVPSLLSP